MPKQPPEPGPSPELASALAEGLAHLAGVPGKPKVHRNTARPEALGNPTPDTGWHIVQQKRED